MPRRTLERYGKGTSRSPEELVNVHLGRRTILPSKLENKLVEYCITVDQRYYGLRRQDIRRMAFQLTKINGLKHSFDNKNQQRRRNGFEPF